MSLIRALMKDIRERAERAGVRIMDEVVSVLAQRRVRTRPKQPWERTDELDQPRREERREERRAPSPTSSTAAEAEPASATAAPAAIATERASATPDRATAKPSTAPATSTPARATTPSEPQAGLQTKPKAPLPEPDDAAEASLPVSYPGVDRIVFVSRDPEWGHAYWQIDNARVHHALAVLGGGRAFIRLLDGDDGTLLYEGETWAERGRYYLRFPEPDQTYAVELVIRSAMGRAITLARSATLTAPPGYRRPPGEQIFVELSAQRAILDRIQDISSPPRLAPDWTKTLPRPRPMRPRRTLADQEAYLAEQRRAEAAAREAALRERFARTNGESTPTFLGASEMMQSAGGGSESRLAAR